MRQRQLPQTIVDLLAVHKEKSASGRKAFLDLITPLLDPTDILQQREEVIAECSRLVVGQVIFDVNGEYANDNPQDESRSLASAYPSRCVVYALTPKPNTRSKSLKLNFYEHPSRSQRVLADRLSLDGRGTIYVRDFLGAEVPSIEEFQALKDHGDKLRARRRILMYWAILKKANFDVNEHKLAAKVPLDPGYNAPLRSAVYGGSTPPLVRSLQEVVNEFDKITEFIRGRSDSDSLLQSSGGNPLFERDERALLGFLNPASGAGTAMLTPYRKYHAADAGNYATEIVQLVDEGKTVIIDLGNAEPEIMEYFSQDLSEAIFRHQVNKFSSNALGNHFVQLCFEEAHNLFPAREEDTVDIYRRLAKEGAKYAIGMVYSTQSVTTINRDLLGQTENFFIAHMASRDEVNALAKVQVAYDGVQDDIMRAKTPGYVRMLTRSHRFVIPVQAQKFTLPTPVTNGRQPS
jgi:hypothetical protein